MWPTLIEVQTANGPAGIHSYGLLVLLGLAGGLTLAAVRAWQLGLSVERLLLAALVAIPGGFVGAKILYALGALDPGALLSVTGGYAWYGGLIGGALAVVLVPSLRADVWRLADVVAPSLALGAAVGRMGCFFAGCCHGVPVQGAGPATPLLAPGTLHGQIYTHPHFPFLSTAFSGGVARIQDVPLYPTQLWQSAGSLAILLVLLTVSRLRRFDGQVAGWFLVLEPILRTAVEAFRGDQRGYVVSWSASSVPSWVPGLAASAGAERGEAVVGLTTSQGIGLMMVGVGIAILLLRRHQGVHDAGPVEDAWVDDLSA